MFVVDYSNFVDHSFYADFKVSYMPGIKASDMENAKVVVNVDSKSAFIYCE